MSGEINSVGSTIKRIFSTIKRFLDYSHEYISCDRTTVNKFSRRLAFLAALFVTLFSVSCKLLSDASFFKRFIYLNGVNTLKARSTS
jgi:hypothetical protein